MNSFFETKMKKTIWNTIDHLHISDTFYGTGNENNMYFPHNLFKVLMLKQLVNFLFDIKLSSDFLQGSKYQQIMFIWS
jgi:hypothetical protein